MKRTCKGCLALRFVPISLRVGFNYPLWECTLGYKSGGCRPLEECPKPTTRKALKAAAGGYP